jgi:hypothetical protein
LVEVVGGEADGDAMDSTKTGVHSALQTKWSSGVWTLHGRIKKQRPFIRQPVSAYLIAPEVLGRASLKWFYVNEASTRRASQTRRQPVR